MRWSHVHHDDYPPPILELSDTLPYIQELRASWRESPLPVPNVWFNFEDQSISLTSLNLVLLNTLLTYVRDRLQPIPVSKESHPELSEEEMEDYGWEDAAMVYGILDSSRSAKTLVDRLAALFFRPSLYPCWIKVDPMFRFPPSWMQIPDGSVSFAVSRQLVTPTRPSMCRRAHTSPVGPLSPALLIGIVDQEVNASVDRHALACAAQSNLQALVMEFTLQQVQRKSPHLPPWVILFGLYFHYDSLSIFAHVPRRDVCHSFPVDTLPFPRRLNCPSDLFLRLQVAVALRTLREHLIKLSSFFSPETVWPLEFMDFEASIVHGMTGVYTPNPSEASRESDMSISMFFDGPVDDDSDEENVKQAIAVKHACGREAVRNWLVNIIELDEDFEDFDEGKEMSKWNSRSLQF